MIRGSKASFWTPSHPRLARHLQRGRWAEAKAASYLERHGLRVLQRNYHSRYGEIDLIVIDPDQTLVFVEVRFRRDNLFADGIESVDRRKQRKLKSTAEVFLSSNAAFTHHACRFDVVSVALNTHNQLQINWICDAFQ